MPKYKVDATIEISVCRIIEADDEFDAEERGRHMGANEWIENGDVQNESVEVDYVHEWAPKNAPQNRPRRKADE